MKKLVIGAVLLLSLSAVAQQAAPPAGLEVPNNMKQYFVVFLMANEKSAKAHENPELLKAHLKYVREQVEEHKIAVVGPFADESKFLGVAIMNVSSADEAKAIWREDPTVKGGWADLDVHAVMLPDLSALKIKYPPKKP